MVRAHFTLVDWFIQEFRTTWPEAALLSELQNQIVGASKAADK